MFPRRINRKSRLIFIVILFILPAMSFAIDFTFASLLASYEPNEVNNVNVSPNPAFSPTLTCTWPVLGSVGDVPQATDGNHVLKLTWTSESDRKIEVGHILNNSTFDLADANYIVVDAYFATESALPAPDKNNVSIWSKWDSNDYWIKCESVPPTVGEWYTVAFYVGNREQDDLNNIDALTFEDMNGTSGTIYLDNLRVQPEIEWPYLRRKIEFAGYWWSIQRSEWQMGAGPNRYTDDPNDVWIDPNEHLHLSIIPRDANWYCSEAVANANLGYGTYVFTVRDEVNSLDPNIVVGLFIYDVPDQQGNHREIDVELTRWGDADDPNNAQFVVQPWNHPGNVQRFKIGYTADTETTTHEITWLPDQIDFRTYYGDPPLENPEDIIETWSYENVNDIPLPGCENPRINFYLMDGKPPRNNQDAEVVIKGFKYLHNIPAYIDMKPEIFNLAKKNQWLTCHIRLGEGYDVTDIAPCCVLLEERIKAERISFSKRKQIATVRFNGSQMQEMLAEQGQLGNVKLTVRGQLTDETRFKGKDTIRVINKKGKK